MFADKIHISEKLVSLLLVLILVTTGFYGLTVEKVAAQPDVSSEVLQIADQYKKMNEEYYVYHVNDKDPLSDGSDPINEWYVIVFCAVDSNEYNNRKITGSVVVDANNFRPLMHNEIPSIDIFNAPALAFYHSFNQNEILQDDFATFAEEKSKEFLKLHLEMIAQDIILDQKIEENDGEYVTRLCIEVISGGIGALLPSGQLPNLVNFVLFMTGCYSAWDADSELDKLNAAKVYLQQTKGNFLDLANLYSEQQKFWLVASEGSYRRLKYIIPGDDSLDELTLEECAHALDNFRLIFEIKGNQEMIDYAHSEIDNLLQQRAYRRDVVNPIIMGFHYDMVLNYRLESRTIPGIISETHTCDSIAVTATYFYDSDNDGSATLYYKQSNSGLWVPYYSMTKDADAKTYTKTISGLSENTNYDIEVEFSDPDGVDIGNPLHAYSINTGECMVSPSTPTIYDLGTSDDGSYHVTWNSDDRATYYILRETIGSISKTYTITSNSKFFTGKGNGIYYYQVIACNNYGCSDWSSSKSITVNLGSEDVPPNLYKIDWRADSSSPNMPYSFDFIAVGHKSVNDWHVKDYDGDGIEEYYLLVGEKFWQWFYARAQDTEGYTVIGFGDDPNNPNNLNCGCVENYADKIWDRSLSYCDSRREYSWQSKVFTAPQDKIQSMPMWAFVSYDIGGWWWWSWGWDSFDLGPTPEGESYHVLEIDPTFTLSASPAVQTAIAGDSIAYTVSISHQGVFNAPVTLSCSGLPVGAICTFSSNPVRSTATSTMTIQTSDSTPAGTYILAIQGSGGGDGETTTVILEILNSPPNQPSSPVPNDNVVNQPIDDITLSWSGGDPNGDAVTYSVYLDTNPDPSTQRCYGGMASCSVTGLNYDTTYYWKVVADDGKASPVSGPVWNFATVSHPNDPPYEPGDPSPSDGATNQPIDLTLSWSGGDPDGDVVTYSVYVDTNLDPGIQMCYGISTSYSVMGLNYDTTYYWKVVADDGKASPVSGPVWEFTTQDQSTNTPPNLPTSLGQYKSDEVTIIPIGSTTSESTVVMKGSVSDSDSNDVQLEVEVRPVGTSFSNTPTCTSGPAVTSGTTASVTCSGLADGPYHWQARARDSNSDYGDWVSFGGNPESSPDFMVDTTPPTVIENTPTGDNVPVNTPITTTFSEVMAQESAQSAFSTSPATIGSFSWSGNTMTYTPGLNLVPDTTYTVTVGTGATDLADNSLQSPYSWQFNTTSSEPTMDIQAEIRNIWTSDTLSPIVLFGQNANLGQVLQAGLDIDSFSDPLPNYDDRCLGDKNYDKSVVSRFREGDGKVRIVLDITGGTGFKPGSEGYIKLINPEYKITKIFNHSDYIGVQPPTMVDGIPFIWTDHSGFGVSIDTEEGSVSWQGRGTCPACACRENCFRMEFLVEKVTVKELTQLTTDPANEHNPSWSPDGNDIIFTRVSSPKKLIKLTLDDLSETQLTSYSCSLQWGHYSPDGTQIAYTKDDCNGWYDVHVVNSDGSSDRCLTCSYSGMNDRVIWHPNSNKIIYENAPNCCNMYPWDIISINPDGSGKTTLVSGVLLLGAPQAMSPDESKILYSTETYRDSHIGWMYIKDLNTNAVTDLGRGLFSRQSQSWQSQIFSPDGSKVLYYSDESGNWDVYTINADGTGKTQLTTDTSDDRSAYFSPDGSKILFVSDRTGNNDIWVMDADGCNKVQLTTNTSDEVQSSWSPDGSKIVFMSDRSGNYDVWVMELSTAFPPVYNTPVGTDVDVELVEGDIDLSFDAVIGGGQTSVTVSANGTPPPSGFDLAGNYYDITTTAIYTGSIDLCITYDESQVDTEMGLKLFHYENGGWVDVTTSLDTTANVICGTVTNLSPFIVAEPIDTTAPLIIMTSPVNDTIYNVDSVNLNYSVNESTAWQGYSLDIAANITLYENTTLSGLIDCVHTLTVYANDTSGNMNSSTVWFAIDTTPPVINTVTLNTTTPNTGEDILVTVNATDNFAVTHVTSNGIVFSQQGGNIWNGTIIATEGTHSVNISASDEAGNTGWNNSTNYTAATPDTAPSSITNPHPIAGTTWLNWTWTNPADPDFNHTEIHLNGAFHAITPSEHYNATDLTPATSYTIGTRTVDTAGNTNQTWVSDTATTLPASGTTIQLTISLDSGWNLISAPLNLATWKLGTKSVVGDPLNVMPENSLTAIYRYNTTSELFEKCTHYDDWGWEPATGSESFTELEPGRGYWVMAENNCDLTFTGTAPSDIDILLDADWNCIGWYLTSAALLGEEVAVGDPLNVTPENSLTSIYRYNTTSELFEKCTHYADWGWAPATGSESFTELEPGRGYWVMAENDCLWGHEI